MLTEKKNMNYELSEIIKAFFKGDLDHTEYSFSFLFITEPEDYDMSVGKYIFNDFSIGFISTDIELIKDFENSCKSYLDSLNQKLSFVNLAIIDYNDFSNYLKQFSKINIRNDIKKYFELCEIYLKTLFINAHLNNKSIYSKKYWSSYTNFPFKTYWYYIGTISYNSLEAIIAKYDKCIDNAMNHNGMSGRRNSIPMISKRG